jgi:hypothetical protein
VAMAEQKAQGARGLGRCTGEAKDAAIWFELAEDARRDRVPGL